MDETKKLEIGKVLGKTFAVYKAGFKQFVALSAITQVLVVCTAAFNAALAYSLLIALLILAVMIAAFYFGIRANVSIYKLARSLTQGVSMTAKESYQSSKGLAGTYFAVALMYAFITIVPLVGAVISFTFVENLILKYALTVLFGIPLIFLYTRYYLAIPSALLSERMNGEFKSSKQLVKGDFWRVLIMIVLTYGIFIFIGQIPSLWTDPAGTDLWPAILSMLMGCVIMIFAVPVGTIAAVLMYQDLNEIKNVDTPKI